MHSKKEAVHQCQITLDIQLNSKMTEVNSHGWYDFKPLFTGSNYLINLQQFT